MTCRRARRPSRIFPLCARRRVQCRLQFDVERARTDPGAVHRTQRLNIADGIEAEAARDAGFYQVDNVGNCSFRAIRLDKIEVALAPRLAQIGEDAADHGTDADGAGRMDYIGHG